MHAHELLTANNNKDSSDSLFEKIARDILHKGYSVQHAALPYELAQQLWQHLQQMPETKFSPAGVGRKQDYKFNHFVRSNKICWISGESVAGKHWLQWTAALQHYLNQHLLLGLFSFESHFAHYSPGDFYKKHLDAFKGESNRVLSLVLYLNPDWQQQEAGELVLYTEDNKPIKVLPEFATVVVFLSEDFPHEVLPTRRDRYSIAGWFRKNGSKKGYADPPV